VTTSVTDRQTDSQTNFAIASAALLCCAARNREISTRYAQNGAISISIRLVNKYISK